MDKFNANESVDATRLEKLFLESGTPKILKKMNIWFVKMIRRII